MLDAVTPDECIAVQAYLTAPDVATETAALIAIGNPDLVAEITLNNAAERPCAGTVVPAESLLAVTIGEAAAFCGFIENAELQTADVDEESEEGAALLAKFSSLATRHTSRSMSTSYTRPPSGSGLLAICRAGPSRRSAGALVS